MDARGALGTEEILCMVHRARGLQADGEQGQLVPTNDPQGGARGTLLRELPAVLMLTPCWRENHLYLDNGKASRAEETLPMSLSSPPAPGVDPDPCQPHRRPSCPGPAQAFLKPPFCTQDASRILSWLSARSQLPSKTPGAMIPARLPVGCPGAAAPTPPGPSSAPWAGRAAFSSFTERTVPSMSNGLRPAVRGRPGQS